jgi:hypothetical protein
MDLSEVALFEKRLKNWRANVILAGWKQLNF